jgi:translation machinery-associated protein 16
MGTNNKKKTIKDIKGLDKAHPYSRKATQMKRAIGREATLSQKEYIRNEPKKRAVDRLLFFKTQLPPHNILTPTEILDILESYVYRNQQEINDLKVSCRQGRPKPNRLSLLESLLEKDIKEYIVGIEMPDLSIPENVEILRTWDGHYGSITRIASTRIKRAKVTDMDS